MPSDVSRHAPSPRQTAAGPRHRHRHRFQPVGIRRRRSERHTVGDRNASDVRDPLGLTRGSQRIEIIREHRRVQNGLRNLIECKQADTFHSFENDLCGAQILAVELSDCKAEGEPDIQGDEHDGNDGNGYHHLCKSVCTLLAAAGYPGSQRYRFHQLRNPKRKSRLFSGRKTELLTKNEVADRLPREPIDSIREKSRVCTEIPAGILKSGQRASNSVRGLQMNPGCHALLQAPQQMGKLNNGPPQYLELNLSIF